MYARILEDGRFNFEHDRILSRAVPLTLSVKADNAVVADILISVRDASHRDLLRVNDGIPLSTGDVAGGVVRVAIDLSKYPAARYIIWNTWANYPQSDQVVFTESIKVEQGAVVWNAHVKAQMPKEFKIAAVESDGLFIGAPLP